MPLRMLEKQNVLLLEYFTDVDFCEVKHIIHKARTEIISSICKMEATV